ncbi:hypothetical protein [Catellatospora tritici]|uniref:hypothetical protein n=1 Tax=Catellatospora tritici TaxID=2851566 RepID=UPI001C2DA721|nr:hypothetical protein [Catellatospora tritici]MBV1855831.1 hypothetical protein [Catellatospora tritici]
MGAGIAGGIAGYWIAGYAMMKPFYANPNRDPQARALARAAGIKLGVNVDRVQFEVENRPDLARYGSHPWGEHKIVINRAHVGNDYLKFRHTVAHELHHELADVGLTPQVHMKLYSRYPHGDQISNPFEREAQNFASLRFDGMPTDTQGFSYIGMPSVTAQADPDHYESRGPEPYA